MWYSYIPIGLLVPMSIRFFLFACAQIPFNASYIWYRSKCDSNLASVAEIIRLRACCVSSSWRRHLLRVHNFIESWEIHISFWGLSKSLIRINHSSLVWEITARVYLSLNRWKISYYPFAMWFWKVWWAVQSSKFTKSLLILLDLFNYCLVFSRPLYNRILYLATQWLSAACWQLILVWRHHIIIIESVTIMYAACCCLLTDHYKFVDSPLSDLLLPMFPLCLDHIVESLCLFH